jgi:hypothetical protein
MAFSISTRHLPSRMRFTNYIKAVEFYNNVKPKRDGTRPLAKNRKGPYEIVLNPYNHNVELFYHSTPVVSITPDDRLILQLGYNSMSTRMFAQALTPLDISVYAHKGNNVVSAGNKEYLTDYAIIDLKTNTFVKGQNVVEVRSVNTQRTKQPRAILRAIEKFMSAAVALTPDYLKTLYDTCPSNIYRQDYADHLRAVDPADPETFLPVVQAMIRHSYSIRMPALMAFLRQELYDAFKVYDWTELPDGTLPSPSQTYRIKEN